MPIDAFELALAVNTDIVAGYAEYFLGLYSRILSQF